MADIYHTVLYHPVVGVAVVGIIVSGGWQLKEFYDQSKAIKNGESISVAWNAYSGAACLTSVLYGWYIDWVLVWGTAVCLVIGHLLLLWSLSKVAYKISGVWDFQALGCIFFFPVVLVVSNDWNQGEYRDVTYLVLSAGLPVSVLFQVGSILKAGHRGDCTGGLVSSSWAGACLWATYVYVNEGAYLSLKILTLSDAVFCSLWLLVWGLLPAPKIDTA